MPRCQRTFRRLTQGRTQAGTGVGRWVCGHCADAELYETVRDPDLLDYGELASTYCVRHFGSPHDRERPTLFVLGLRPECVREPADRRYDVYLQRDSDPCQLRLQIGHEVFHRVCSQGAIFHWTHEMLACLVSLRLLKRYGMGEYAARREQEWLGEAAQLEPAQMLQVDLWQTPCYPPGFYGRAYATGLALVQAVGWGHLCSLARCLSPQGAPDLDRWVAGLSPDVAPNVRAALTQTLFSMSYPRPHNG